MVVGLLEDIEITIEEMQPQVYESVGKHRLLQQMDSHMAEKSNPFSMNSATLYANSVQKNMVSAANSKKIISQILFMSFCSLRAFWLCTSIIFSELT